MKVYHVTSLENKESILKNGIEATLTDKLSDEKNRIEKEGVYFFTSLEIADKYKDSVVDDCEYAIFEAEINESELENDPEYEDNEAVFFDGDVQDVILIKIID